MPESDHVYRWREAVLSTSGPPAMRRHVLVTLSTFADPDGSSCFPSTRLMADRTGLSRRRVEGHLRDAVEEGWIERKARGDGRAWRRLIYVLVIPDVETERPHPKLTWGQSVPISDVGTLWHDVGTKRPLTWGRIVP